MRKVTATEKYRAVNEGQMSEGEFVRQMRLAFPQHINQFNGYHDSIAILKNRGVLSESTLEKMNPDTVSDDSLRRALDIELTAMGHDPVTCSDGEAQAKAKDKALKNLTKDPLHYYNLLAQESSKVDKNDKMKETKPGAKDKDTFNDMKKADLKENYTKEKLLKRLGNADDARIQTGDGREYIVYNPNSNNDDNAAMWHDDSVHAVDQDGGEHEIHYKDIGLVMVDETTNESNQEESIADFIIKHYTNPKTGKSLIDDEIIGDFFRTHPESKDEQDPQDALDNFEEYLLVNYEMPGDYMQEKVATSADDVIDPADYGTIGANYLKGFEKAHSLNQDQLEQLGRKIVDQLYKGDFDAAKEKHMQENNVTKESKAFAPGDMFSTDFDYKGMLKYATTVSCNTPLSTLQALFDSFEDVNYHREASHLSFAIEELEEGNKEGCQEHIDAFKKEVKATIKSIIQENGGFVREADVEEGFNDHLSSDDLKDLAQHFQNNGNAEAAKHIMAAAACCDSETEAVAENEYQEEEELELDADYDKGGKYYSEEGAEAFRIQPFKLNDIEYTKDQAMKQGKYIVGLEGEVLKKFISDYMAAWEADKGDTAPDRTFKEDLAEGRKKTKGGKVVTENDYETGGYVESMGPKFDKGVNFLIKAWEEWKMGPMTEPGMIEFAKKDILSYLETQFMVENLEEKKGKDLDGDGDVDKDDYKHAKDKAIKKAMNKDEIVKENLKAIITKVLADKETLSEAATQELSKFADDYSGFDGMKSSINGLENIVTDIEQYFDKTRAKIQKIYDTLGEIRNEEGLKVGGFLAPAIEQAFMKDLKPVTKMGFTKGLDQPKVKTISSAEIDMAKRQQGLSEFEAEPKQTVFGLNEKKK